MTIKAVFVDMDGTLFDKRHRISPRSVEAIRALKAKGAFFIVATGRPFPDVFGTLGNANLHPDFIVTSNGSRVHDAQHETVFQCDLDAEAVCRIFQLSPHLTAEGVVDPAAPKRQIYYNVNCKDRWLTNECLSSVRAAFHPSYLYEQVDPMAFTPASLQGTHGIWVSGAHEDLNCVRKFIEREFDGVVSCTFALPHILDIFPAGMNKGVALARVCEKLSVSPSEAIAFGDGMNDLQMLRAAGHGFVMANAAPMVKEAATGLPVIDSNDNDGVAKKIEELLAAGAFQ
ncbi:Haloacid dehalogenase-like hydrolase putativehaloacid dehalogenase-like hydrolase-like protein [Leptomonas pyrrhocoris]|uniref:Haloacid dehalogenase-like hydrolase putativehaloacid dehalogenase-like hydrolase-like protein n=1 Tax=Leptomonas pyrrhocoris TaxID=157538 RepID=A0A0M9G9H8_LEPPY|nr:Haloacid dehalogenase-like hydrolase putativehaloacid dehalogenase-like hydrolase-like protein [Leptomonas pyrrhocoris]KPA85359.1 Haloacid dehalogenase-like hydrolase putativehaloacid dehalogenase-like hydrolase-like protein [Leptomonas pyrrhocoris]|eukprot:XP_015663798.1 Haloacid dehalogenase-like hydrolase putativehaloacid dehalogenase-like hydrolase-like protein [Leptomonas pyrrhocoris]